MSSHIMYKNGDIEYQLGLYDVDSETVQARLDLEYPGN